MKKILTALPVVLAIGGCNGRGESAAPNLDMMAQASVPSSFARSDSRPRAISVDSALARLPEGAGRPKAGRDRRHPNGYWQEISLASDVAGAESFIVIAIQNGRPMMSVDKAPVWKPGEAGIRDELVRHFPNMSMQVVANGQYENQFGRFGLAIGRQGESLRCIYAWQYIDDARRSFANGKAIPLDGANEAPAALRVKLCRADASVDDLVAFARQVSVVIPDNFGAADEVLAAPAAFAAPRHFAAATPTVTHVRRPHRAVRSRHYAAPPAYVQAPTAYVAAPQAAAVYAPQAAGPRFMAPVAIPGAVAPNPSGAGLNPNLPPQAYRGPGAAGAYGAPPAQNQYQRSSSLPVDRSATGAIVPAPKTTAEGAPRVVPLP